MAVREPGSISGEEVTMAVGISGIGALLREWRSCRGLSQARLAAAANVSARHLCFVETGRAEPSREMVLTLARALDVPLRDRNAMLTAAGYAPVYRETRLDAPEMAEMRRALRMMLHQAQPFFAVALDRRWDVVMCNEAFARWLGMLSEKHARVVPYQVIPPPRPNSLRLLFDTLRPIVANWSEVASCALERARRETALDRDSTRRQVLEECMAAAPAGWRPAPSDGRTPLVVPVHVSLPGMEVRMFCTISSLGTAQDVTLQELRVEVFHPADEVSERRLRALAEGGVALPDGAALRAAGDR